MKNIKIIFKVFSKWGKRLVTLIINIIGATIYFLSHLDDYMDFIGDKIDEISDKMDKLSDWIDDKTN
jgi:hypothetical protein